MHKIEHRIFLTFVIAIGQIYDSMLLELLALFVVEKRFVCIVIKVLQSALLFRLGQVIVGNWDKFIRKSVCSFIYFKWYTAVFALYVIVFIRGLRNGRTTRRKNERYNIQHCSNHNTFFIALSFKAFHPSRYIAFAYAGTETPAFLPIARACLLGK